MFLKPLSQQTIGLEALRQDKKGCKKFGPCGVGEKALYLNSFFIDRMYYVPFSAVTRVFKRVAMSKGGFTGKGVFASIPYLVVVFDNGQEKQCNFKREEHVDAILAHIKESHPHIPLQSETVEKEYAVRTAEEEQRRQSITLTKDAKEEIQKLEQAKQYLEQMPSIGQRLSSTAKAKRINEYANPAYRWVALVIVLLGVAAGAYGIWALVTKAGFGIYFTLFGFAAVFLFAGANVLPTGKTNKQFIDNKWTEACEAAENYLNGFQDSFPVPARYAHPVTLTRMIRAIQDDRAKSVNEALELVKRDLQALNADVQVEQDEYEEITTIKPMFLVSAYL